MSGNSRDGITVEQCARPPLAEEARARVATPFAGASTVRSCSPISPRKWSGAGAKYPVSSPPTKRIQGNRRHGLLLLNRRNPCLHHLELQKNLLCFQLGARGGPETKPLRSVGSEGFDQIELWKSFSSSCPREKHAHVTAQVRRPVGKLLRDEWRGAHHQSLSLVAGDYRRQRARCMIADHGEVKARLSERCATRSTRIMPSSHHPAPSPSPCACRCCRRREDR